MKRIFDIFFSATGLVFLFIPFLIVALWIKTDSKGAVFFKQKRIGLNANPFYIYKFRTMFVDSDKKGHLTVGQKDNRITKAGFFLRKYKIDELPQLINILLGEMSFVGPRPEVEKYVNYYNESQRQVLSVKPGLTDFASLMYFDENRILESKENPEEAYIKEIMPHKLKLNLEYIQQQSFLLDLKIIFRTLLRIAG
ncbi:MAG: sugar transferase [Chitinophagaceae bacterium]|nr:MAG: sugar transferase [Chitinophagaceae bacterium]